MYVIHSNVVCLTTSHQILYFSVVESVEQVLSGLLTNEVNTDLIIMLRKILKNKPMCAFKLNVVVSIVESWNYIIHSDIMDLILSLVVQKKWSVYHVCILILFFANCTRLNMQSTFVKGKMYHARLQFNIYRNYSQKIVPQIVSSS